MVIRVLSLTGIVVAWLPRGEAPREAKEDLALGTKGRAARRRRRYNHTSPAWKRSQRVHGVKYIQLGDMDTRPLNQTLLLWPPALTGYTTI